MRALIVLAHPEPKSFNGHLAKATKTKLSRLGYEVQLHDIYADGFDPREHPMHFPNRKDPHRFDAQTEQRFNWEQNSAPIEIDATVNAVLDADLVFFQFPLWWFGPPAILKGWLDRVFVYGAMYRSSARYDKGPCRGKRAIVCVTTGASAEACSFNGHEGDTRLILWPFLFSLRYVGFTVLEPNLIFGVRGGLTGEEAKQQDRELAAAENNYLARMEQLTAWPAVPFNKDSDFDADGILRPGAPVHSPFIRHQAVSAELDI